MSNKYLDPIAAVEQPRADFIRYLLTAYPLRDPHLRYGFKQLIEQRGNLWQHPYLEGSQPYRASRSLNDLVTEGVLHPEMARLFTPSNRRFYEHQERAIRTVINQKQNIVVATGTGSGKTECFLVPMLDTLLKEEDNLSLAGVRVLILYPMNALINDQVKRLRQLLCRQQTVRIKFGFYTSRTEKKKDKALESLRAEFAAYEPEELRQLFNEESIADQELIDKAIEKTASVQLLSREEMWDAPPHILITNYSMLEHMLLRPKERRDIFAASAQRFKMLVVDEAHTYGGAKGTEVSMLLERFKAAVGIEQEGKIRCIATSASLGNESVDSEVLKFATQLFRESFSWVIRGKRLTPEDRLGKPYTLQGNLNNQEIFEYLSILELPAPDAPINQWFDQLSAIIPEHKLREAELKANRDIHKFLWFALKKHPLIHRLIDILAREPQPWERIVRSTKLWGVELPIQSDGSVDDTDAKPALARLLQLGTLARENSEDLPLVPVRLHLLFRTLDGVYACINPDCPDCVRHPNYPELQPKYGRLYVNQKKTCDSCNSPVLELGSCSQCGQAYVFTQRLGSGKLESLPKAISALKENPKIFTLTSGTLESMTDDEEVGEQDEERKLTVPKTFTFRLQHDGWIGVLSEKPFTPETTEQGEFNLAWHRGQDDINLNGCYLTTCSACRAGYGRTTLAINRFISYNDNPLEAMIDSIFELLPEPEKTENCSTRCKLLTFSDGRQDAAFFASNYQRSHTEMLYRQMLWQAFQDAKKSNGIASVNRVTKQLKNKFLEISIPHPDRDEKLNYRSYCPEDREESLQNTSDDCEDSSEARAKEILLREFALPFNRRSTLEAFALLTCHIELDQRFIELVAQKFEISNDEARIFLIVLTDIIRRAGIVSIEGASRYFPETGGVQGGRPEMVDVQGKSKNYLFLEKSGSEYTKYKDSPVFIPWKNGQVRNPPNRIGWYLLQLFGDNLPQKEHFTWLFRQLQDSRTLSPAKKAYQLSWERLYIIETQQDWYKCNLCQQIFQIPGLSQITQSKLNLKRCSAYKCKGTLEPHTSEKNVEAANENYQQHMIQKPLLLPLRSQEHTAQLGVAELEKRENRFRRGRINMLSCSTTLEMGVDIGELQAVVLRNFPPHVSNYQQRTGRAGRRADGVAVTLMYGQRRSHDRFYFEQPDKLINGSNQIPKLDSGNFQIQQRHIHAELLAAFLRNNWSMSAEDLTLGQFLLLPEANQVSSEKFTPPPEAMICKFYEWLKSDEARNITVLWLTRLNSEQAGYSTKLLESFDQEIKEFQQQQIKDWDNLVDLVLESENRLRDRAERNNLMEIARRIKGIERELKKVAARRLHGELAQASVLPIYGFPIDVVRLLTEQSDEYDYGKGKHRLERDRRLALGEYAPDQEIIVDDRMYKSVGILKPEELEDKFYWVCQNCYHFMPSDKKDELVNSCPVCSKEPSPPAAKKKKRYKVPKVFTTDWEKRPQVTPYIKPQRQPTSQIFLMNPGETSDTVTVQMPLYNLTVSKGGNFFLANQGSSGKNKAFEQHGFAICDKCGRDLSEFLPKEEQKNTKAQNKRGKSNQKPSDTQTSLKLDHKHPITGYRCPGPDHRPDFIHLGHEFRSDLLKIFFTESTDYTPLFESDVESEDDDKIVTDARNCNQGLEFWHSLTYSLLAAAAQVIDVPSSELDGLFVPLKGRRAEIIIYDNVPGGAGYSRRIGDRFDEVLQKALEIVSSCTCETSCYDCLQTYSNQQLHNQLNRHLVEQFLHPIVEQVSPDIDLQNFAPNAYRVNLSSVNITALCRLAAPDTLIYLPQLRDEFDLDNGKNKSWLNRLTDAVYSLKRSDQPLELILSQLPDPNVVSDSDVEMRNHLKICRKRLQQWIEQGLVKLYQASFGNFPILCLSTQQNGRIALELHKSSKDEFLVWFQTRSREGVETVVTRLENLRSQAKAIAASELEDPNTIVVFPDPKDQKWSGNLSMSDLREKLRLQDALSGSQVKKVVYRDRYLRVAGAEILADLLQGDGLDSQSRVLILTVEDRDARDASDLSKKLTTVFARLQPTKNNLKVHVKRWHERFDLPHGRDLEIYRQDGQEYKVIFDKGMAFLEASLEARVGGTYRVTDLEARVGGTYRVTEPTYVVVDRTV